MKLLTLITILFIQIPLFAQPSSESKANIRFAQLQDQDDRRVPLRPKDQIAANEQETDQLAQTFQNASTEQKTSIQKQITDLLYETLELKIKVKEENVTFLKRELDSMKAQQADQDVARIEKALTEIKKEIVYRKDNRDKIVALRLKELLKL